jgi:hypothetical protein
MLLYKKRKKQELVVIIVLTESAVVNTAVAVIFTYGICFIKSRFDYELFRPSVIFEAFPKFYCTQTVKFVKFIMCDNLTTLCEYFMYTLLLLCVKSINTETTPEFVIELHTLLHTYRVHSTSSRVQLL